jgi:hypothetical protein
MRGMRKAAESSCLRALLGEGVRDAPAGEVLSTLQVGLRQRLRWRWWCEGVEWGRVGV